MSTTVQPDTNPAFADFAHPEVLVTTQWVADHLDDPNVRILESDEDIMLYEVGHIPGALKLDWLTQMQQEVDRDFVDKAGFEALCNERGITPEMTVVFYGVVNNWYATYGFWLFKYYGHDDVRVMDGGRAKWEAEGRPFTREVPDVEPTEYVAEAPDGPIRALRLAALQHLQTQDPAIVDVRSPGE